MIKRGEIYYARKERKLNRQLCKLFAPHRQFFLSQCQGRIVESQPQLTIQSDVRNNLTLERQLMHLRGIQKSDCLNEVEFQLMIENKGFVRSKGNCSLVIKNFLYFSHMTLLKKVNLDVIESETIQKEVCFSVKKGYCSVVLDLHEQIRQIQHLSDQNLILRLPRKIVIVNIITETMRLFEKFDKQLISISIYRGSRSKIYMTTFQNQRSQIHIKYLDDQSSINILNTQKLIRGHDSLTKNDLILYSEDGLKFFDLRKSKQDWIYRIQQKCFSRIYGGLLMSNNHYAITGESKSLNIYDLRKNNILIKIPHYCEESPPSILQTVKNLNIESLNIQNDEDLKFYQNDSINKEEVTRIIAHSPQALGSTLMVGINPNYSMSSNLLHLFEQGGQLINYCQLLYDAGKMHLNYYPRSVTYFTKDDHLILLHTDNFGGVATQIFNKQANKNKKNSLLCDSQIKRVHFACQQKELKDPNLDWFLKKQTQKYIAKDIDDYWNQIIENDSEYEIDLQKPNLEERKIRYANLSYFFEAIYNKSKKQALQKPLSQKLKVNSLLQSTIQATQSIREGIKLQKGLNYKKITQAELFNLMDSWELSF